MRPTQDMKIMPPSRRRHYPVTFSVFLVMAALIAGMAGCGPYPYSLTISSTEGGEATAPGEGRFVYSEVTEVTIVADAYEGHRFIAWTGDANTVDDVNAAVTTVTVNGDYSITANFCPKMSGDLEIRTWYDLADVRCNLAGNHTLMNDLDSTTAGYEELASPTANGGKGWQPIGGWDTGFNGTFEGQGYEIRELFINRPDENDVGLFGYLEGGRIENIGIVDATVTGEGEVAGLVVWNEGGTVSNSYCTGSMTGRWDVGGLVAINGGNVSDSYARCSLIGYEQPIGGLVAYNFDNVSNSYCICNVTGKWNIGGLAGINEGTVKNSHSTGNVIGDEIVGGLVGTNAGTVSDSYSTGSVTGNEYVGGLVGSNSQGSVNTSFWDVQTSGQTTSNGGTGKTTAEMQDITTFSGAGWDIIAVGSPGTRNPAYIWNTVDNETYPFLSWQP